MHVRKLVCRQFHDDWDKMTKRLISHMICVYIEGKKWATHASLWLWALKLKKKIHFCAVFVHFIKTKLDMELIILTKWKKHLRCKKKCFYHNPSEVLFVVVFLDHTLIIHWEKCEEATLFHGFTSWPWWEAKVITYGCRSKSYFSAFIHSFIRLVKKLEILKCVIIFNDPT